jgi:hypothetical protein
MYTELRVKVCLLFCVGVKLGLSHSGQNIGCGCSRVGCWVRYLDLRGKLWDWIKQHNKKPHDLYFSRNIWVVKSRRIRRAGHVARMEEKINAYRILVGKPEGDRHRRRWEDTIKTNGLTAMTKLTGALFQLFATNGWKWNTKRYTV